MFVLATLLRNRVISVSAPGITAHDPFDSEPASVEQAVHLKRLQKIGRAGGRIPAHGGREGRNAIPVDPDERH